ncbi:MAG TPA: HAMP domain-containing sensor histidine kinase [Gemmatimonadaceae bacterium]
MSASSDGTLVLLTAATPDERERLRRELEAAGVRARLVDSVEEARAAYTSVSRDDVPRELAQMTVHNLKTPLTSMLAALEMLAEGDLGAVNERQALALRETRARALELLALIDDLLELWKVESVSVPLMPELIDPDELLADVRREWILPFERAGARLYVEDVSAPSFPGDRAVLRRVLSNLIHNALLHAGDGVTVRLAARCEGDTVIITVSDDGRGIPREYHHLLFTRFPRLPRSVTPTRGTGLGLAFCRQAVASHGGQIEVESDAGQGCVFTVRLPCEIRASAEMAQA